MSSVAAIFVAAVAIVSSNTAHAINITVESVAVPKAPPAIPFAKPKPVPPPPAPKMRITGMIETGDAGRLEAALAKVVAAAGNHDGPLTTIELSSMGGNLLEGFEIGGLLRKFRMIAVVRKSDLCLSSCALAFLGGNVHRVPPSAYPQECNVEIGGKVAFHNFFLNRNGLREGTPADPVASRLQGFADARGGAAQLVKYAGEMGLPPNFVANLMGKPVEEFQYIETVGQFLSFHVCPIGLDRPSAPLEVQARNACVNSMARTDGAAPQVRALADDQVKPVLLGRVQANMQSSKARGRLAAQLASNSVMRNREETDRLYDDLRAAGVALPDIVGPTFEVTGLAPDTSCYVSLSTSEPDTFDVALFGLRGFSDPPHEPPDNSRRLFLYDKDDVVNPKAN